MPVINSQIRRAALHSGLSPGYISRVLRGKRNPRLSTFNKIAVAMRMSTIQLQRLIDRRSAEGVDPQVSLKISEGLKRYREERNRTVSERPEGTEVSF